MGRRVNVSSCPGLSGDIVVMVADFTGLLSSSPSSRRLLLLLRVGPSPPLIILKASSLSLSLSLCMHFQPFHELN